MESATKTTNPHEVWGATEAAFNAALAAERSTSHARIDAGQKLLRDEPSIVYVWLDPRLAELIKAEQAAMEAAHDARDALTGTPVPDWRAFAFKFQIVREWVDDLLNPLDHRDGGKERDFPGSRLAARIHHYALAAHLGVPMRSESVRAIPKMLRKLGKSVARIDPKHTHALHHDDCPFVPFGFAHLYADAVRLVASGPVPVASSSSMRTIPTAGPMAAAWNRAKTAYIAASAASDVYHIKAHDQADGEGSDASLDAKAAAMEAWEAIPPPSIEALAEVMLASLDFNGWEWNYQRSDSDASWRDLLDGGDTHEIFAARYTLHALRLCAADHPALSVVTMEGLFEPFDHNMAGEMIREEDWRSHHAQARIYPPRYPELVEWWRAILTDPTQKDRQNIVGRDNCRAAFDATVDEDAVAAAPDCAREPVAVA